MTLNVAVFCSFVCCREGFSLSPHLDKDEKWIFFFLHLYMSTVHLLTDRCEQAAAAAASLRSQRSHASIGQRCVLQVSAPGHGSVPGRAPCKVTPSAQPPVCLGCTACKISMPVPLSCSRSPAALASSTSMPAGRHVLILQYECFNKDHHHRLH